LDTDGDLLCFAAEIGLHCLDISDLENPQLLGSYSTKGCGDAVRFTDYIAVTSWIPENYIISLVSTVDPENLKTVDSLESEGSIWDIASWEAPNGCEYLVVNEYTHYFTLKVYLIENDMMEVTCEGFDFGSEYEHLNYFDVTPWESGVLIVANERADNYDVICGHLWVISLMDPTQPVIISHLSQEPIGDEYRVFNYGALLMGNKLLIPGMDPFIESSYIISITDPENPRFLTCNLDDSFYEPITVSGDILFARESIYRIHDPEFPDDPVEFERLGQINRLEYSQCLSEQNGLLVSYNWLDYQLTVYNVNDPSNPQFRCGTYLYDGATRIYMDNGTFYAVTSSGIQVLRYTGADGVDDASPLPFGFELSEPCPNPFNSRTVLRFTLPSADVTTLKVYNLTGREIARLEDRWLNAGRHSVSIDAEGWASGVYLAKMTFHGETRTAKMVVIK